jgi:hypothetical protein
MEAAVDLFSALPTGQALYLFVACLFIGGFVIFKFCLDQFDKPDLSYDENDPWKFVVPRYLTPRRQFLTGFFAYWGTLTAIYLIISIAGPSPISDIVQAIAAASTQTEVAPAGQRQEVSSFIPTFPILVAFWIVGLNPNLPKFLDLETFIRHIGYRIAYIPKNMNDIFNFMRFSEFEMPEQNLKDAWDAIGLRRLVSTDSDLQGIFKLFDRAVLLYVRAATMSGDLNLTTEANLQQYLSLDVFRQYRSQLQNVLVTLQAAHGRISEQLNASAEERRATRQNVERDLIRSLAFLYVLFACAITVGGIGQLRDRLRAIGFSTPYPPPSDVPWDPILKVAGACILVIFAALEVAAETFQGAAQRINIPTTPPQIFWLLLMILITHVAAIALAMRVRSQLILSDRYFLPESGGTRITAYARIFVLSAFVSFVAYVLLNLVYVPAIVSMNPQAVGQFVRVFLLHQLAWTIVPGCCGFMTALTIDWPARTFVQRATSGLMEGGVMAAAALLAVNINFYNEGPMAEDPFFGFLIFNCIIYGGLGFVFGFVLPAAIRRHWAALEARLPDKISMLRSAALSYFYDTQQFSEWLNMRDDRLEGRRPLDILAEESGLTRLISFVNENRMRVSAASK